MSLNPFTLKELRQLTRSRVISGALILFLFASVLATYLIPLSGITNRTGTFLALYLSVALSVMFSVVLPINVFIRMMKERRGKSAADLTLVTPLPPSSVIDGKLRSAYALIFLFSAASLPFGVAAYLLHGVTFVEMFRTLVLVVAGSSLVVHLTIAIAAMRCSAVLRVIIFVLLIFMGTQYVLFGTVLALHSSGGSWEDCVWMLAMLSTISLLLRAFAVAWVSPKTADRDLSIRVLSLLAAVGWIGYELVRHWNGFEDRDFENSLCATQLLFVALAVLLAVGAMTLDVGYSARQLASRPVSPWRRALVWPFRTGAVNGLAFALGFGTLVALVLPLVAPHINELYRVNEIMSGCGGRFREVEDPLLPLVLFFYVVSPLMYVRAIWYQLRRVVNIRPVYVPVIALLILGLYQTLPSAVELSGGVLSDDLPFYFSGVKDRSASHFGLALIAFVLGLLAMLPETIRSFRRPRG